MTSSYADKGLGLDPILIKKILKELDKDVATRFVASALSLSPKKLNVAFEIALQEMSIRQKEARKKKKAKTPKSKCTAPPPLPSRKSMTDKKIVDDVLESITALFDAPDLKIEAIYLDDEDVEIINEADKAIDDNDDDDEDEGK